MKKRNKNKNEDRQTLPLSCECLQENKLTVLIAILLFSLGVYQSIILFGYKTVPNSDFPGFYRAGKAILSFKLPDTYKRAPVTGILQVAATNFVSGDYRDLKAGWLVNSILHPLNLVLMWLVGKIILGNSARWFALIIAINAWILYLATEPIAETTYLFFILLTVLFIFKRSPWAYLLAAITTMVRYEAGALILAAFVVDMIYAENKKQRWIIFSYAFIASIPLIFWLSQMVITSDSDSVDYFNVFKMSRTTAVDSVEDKTGIGKHLNLIWYTGYSSLISIPYDSSKEAFGALANFSKFLAGLTFGLGIFYAAIRKNRQILVLLIFLVPYFLIHAYYPYPIPRFHHTSFWIALLVSFYGIIELWKTINKDNRVPAVIVAVAQSIAALLSLIWLIYIYKNIGICKKVCPDMYFIPYAAAIVALLIAAAQLYCNNFKGKLKELTVLVLVLAVIVSNQISVASLMRTGKTDAEFKMLADWYLENAEEGEGLATTLASVVRIFCKKGQIHCYRNAKSANLEEFADYLEKRSIRYVAWDSRIGLAPRDPYYGLKILDVVSPLAKAQNNGRFKLIKQFRNGNRFINLYEIENFKPAKTN